MWSGRLSVAWKGTALAHVVGLAHVVRESEEYWVVRSRPRGVRAQLADVHEVEVGVLLVDKGKLDVVLVGPAAELAHLGRERDDFEADGLHQGLDRVLDLAVGAEEAITLVDLTGSNVWARGVARVARGTGSYSTSMGRSVRARLSKQSTRDRPT